MKKFQIEIPAIHAVEIKGNVYRRTKEEQQPDGFTLTGSKYESYLDMSNPLTNTSNFLSTIPAGQDQAAWDIELPKDGYYRITFRYNNPGFMMGGARNLRDERNCRVMIDDDSLGRKDNWLGWMIFSVSGYNQDWKPYSPQTKETVAGNQEWNLNHLNCYLTAGIHRLYLTNEAPPGQAVYDGPNLDFIQVESYDENYMEESQLVNVSSTHSFQHPGIFQSANDLEKLIFSYQKNVFGVRKAVEELMNANFIEDERVPHSITAINVGPYNAPNIGGNEWTTDCIAAHDLALLWIITGEKCYAKKTMAILNTWARYLKEVADGNDLMLRFSLVGVELINAAELIRHHYNQHTTISQDEQWQTAEIIAFENFIREKLLTKTAAFYPQANGNWDAIITAFNLACGIFLEDTQLMDRCLRQFQLGNVAGGACLSMGALPNYVYPTGESQESNRDQVHARMGLTGLANVAHLASRQGFDLFSLYQARLLVGFNYNAAYQIGKNVVSETFISDRGCGQVDISSLGFECILAHYTDNKELADIELAVIKTLRGAKNEGGMISGHRGSLLYGK